MVSNLSSSAKIFAFQFPQDFDMTTCKARRFLRQGKSGRNLDVILGAGIFDVLGSTEDPSIG
jgi:hypothetical protein